MDNLSIDECIALIKNGKKVEARQVLQNILQSDLHNLKGWYWYVETFDTPEQRVKALRLCLKYNPDNQKVKDAIHTFETKYPQAVKSASISNKSIPHNVQTSKRKNNNKSLWIIGSFFGIGLIGVTCILAVGILLKNPTSVTTISPQSTNVPTFVSTQTNTPAPSTGKWQVSTSKSEFDNSTTVLLSLDAENTIEGWLTITLPTLVLMCREKELNVYVDVGTQSDVEYGLYDKATVRVRFDQNQAFETVANESTDGEALFFQDPHGMINSMLRSSEMVFGFTPFNASPAVMTFDLRDLKNVIEPLKQSCNWNGGYPTVPPLPTIQPTATPLPSGSTLNITGIDNKKWKIEVEKIEVTNSVTAYGETTKAGGQFVLLFLRVTNTGNDPQFFTGSGDVQVRNAEGITYDEDYIASRDATVMYGFPDTPKIQPGDTVQQIVGFDLPLDSAFYLLTSNYLWDKNGQSIKLEIP
ncbi:MAG TPA: type VI secretion system-associated protein TagO [Anaerolineales bacterium]|nr:type VI secretion system-associated protein TagO [Anaerolineales bacterium]